MTWLLWPLVWLPLILLAVYPLAIQYERGGWWHLLLPVYLVAGLLDMLLNYTVLAVYTWDWPQAGEYTFSRRLERLLRRTDWRRWFALLLKPYLDKFDPKGVHIHV